MSEKYQQARREKTDRGVGWKHMEEMCNNNKNQENSRTEEYGFPNQKGLPNTENK